MKDMAAEPEVSERGRDVTRMPAAVRRVVWTLGALVAGFALYLVAVRATAIIHDLGQFGAALFCL